MKLFPSIFPAVLAVAVSLASNVRAEELPLAPRQQITFATDWKFHRLEPLQLQNVAAIEDWRWKAGEANADNLAAATLDTAGDSWKSARSGEETFGGRIGFSWFRTALPALKSARGQERLLQFKGVDDNAVVYLNGQKLLEHAGWNDAFEVPLDKAWRDNGPNVVTVRVENTEGGGGITGAVNLGLMQMSITEQMSADFNDRAWQTVRVPHDYIVENAPDKTAEQSRGYRPLQKAWYRRRFTVPASAAGKKMWLDFGGVFRNCTVYLNGQKIGTQISGYAPFRFDISDRVKYGTPNLLAVFVDPVGGEGWWYEGGGIYRPVKLTITNPLHIAPWGVYVHSTLPEPKTATQTVPNAPIIIETELNNDGAASTGRIVARVADASGKIVASVASPLKLASGEHRIIQQKLNLNQAQLWSIERPQLYRVQVSVERNGRAVDGQSSTFGVRTLRFDANTGFYLNGQPVKIKGTCNHQDFAGVGVALTPAIFQWRVQKLKEMGGNAYRTAHNAVATGLLDECDRQGMLVMDETRHLGDSTSQKTPKGAKYDDLSDWTNMVKRDRNHPSVIMWSLANEEPLQGSEEGARIFKAMADKARPLDATRPFTAGKNGGFGSGFTTVQDLEGFNYSIGSYDNFHKNFPNIPAFGSETASATSTRGIYENDEAKGWQTNYDHRGGGWANTAQDAWEAIATRPWMAGAFVWTGFDYRGEPTPYSWPDINSHFGVLDLAGFPKDSWWYYKAWWDDKPLVHIFPHWNWPAKLGQPIEVWAYGNAARVELSLNGQSLGSKEMPKYRHVEWSVPYAPGVLLARGYDAAGKLIATDRVETTGAPVALRLKTTRTALKADGEDVSMIEVTVVDAQGRVVPTADNMVNFNVQGVGRVVGVGNGDPANHEPDIANKRSAFNGWCLAIVGAAHKGGAMNFVATSPGLKSATLKLSAR